MAEAPEQQELMPEPTGPGIISERIEQRRRSERMVLLVVRLLFLVLLATVTTLTIGAQSPGTEFSGTTLISVIISTLAVGVIVLGVDYLTPNKRLAAVVAVYLGICVGLLGAVAIAKLIDVVALAWGLIAPPRLTEIAPGEWIEIAQPSPYIELAKVVVGIVLCYLAVSFVLTTKDDFRFVIPYVEFSKQVRGVRPLVLDTSVLIDGRIESMVESGFMDAPLVVPMFVVEELQELSDSGDRLKRARGRRGLDTVSRLQSRPEVDLSLESFDVPGHSVDHKLVDLANMHDMRILTTDYNLVKVARINGATALNVNDLASGLKAGVVPGENIRVEIVKPGENEGQGVGFMPDGTMIVVEDGAPYIGSTIDAIVTNSLQTSAGRMIFARLESAVSNGSDAEEPTSVAQQSQRAGRAATSQPRRPAPPPATGRSGDRDSSRRNPRR